MSRNDSGNDANSFLSSVGLEISRGHGSDPYSHSDMDYHRGSSSRRDDGRRSYSSRDDRYYDRDRSHGRDRHSRSSRDSRDKYDRSSRDRSYRSSRHDDRDYQKRRRSRSPRPRRSRSTSRRVNRDAVPLDQRPRVSTKWDILPPGMENMSAEQVKQTGLFPLPGQVVGTRTPQSFQRPEDAINNKRLFVSGYPSHVNRNMLMDFFESKMQQDGCDMSRPVTSILMTHDAAIVDFETPDLATFATKYHGSELAGSPLVTRRPPEYRLPVGDVPHKLFIGGLPDGFSDEQIRLLFETFGPIKEFSRQREPNGKPKGFAFIIYEFEEHSDMASKGLNGESLRDERGERRLVVHRAKQGNTNDFQTQSMGTGAALSTVVGLTAKDEEKTRVLLLMNMLTEDDFEGDFKEEDLKDIRDDIREECSKYGTVLDMKIPPPIRGKPYTSMVYVRFEAADQALAALHELAGRKYDDRKVIASFAEEDEYVNQVADA